MQAHNFQIISLPVWALIREKEAQFSIHKYLNTSTQILNISTRSLFLSCMYTPESNFIYCIDVLPSNRYPFYQ